MHIFIWPHVTAFRKLGHALLSEKVDTCICVKRNRLFRYRFLRYANVFVFEFICIYMHII